MKLYTHVYLYNILMLWSVKWQEEIVYILGAYFVLSHLWSIMHSLFHMHFDENTKWCFKWQSQNILHLATIWPFKYFLFGRYTCFHIFPDLCNYWLEKYIYIYISINSGNAHEVLSDIHKYFFFSWSIFTLSYLWLIKHSLFGRHIWFCKWPWKFSLTLTLSFGSHGYLCVILMPMTF